MPQDASKQNLSLQPLRSSLLYHVEEAPENRQSVVTAAPEGDLRTQKLKKKQRKAGLQPNLDRHVAVSKPTDKEKSSRRAAAEAVLAVQLSGDVHPGTSKPVSREPAESPPADSQPAEAGRLGTVAPVTADNNKAAMRISKSVRGRAPSLRFQSYFLHNLNGIFYGTAGGRGPAHKEVSGGKGGSLLDRMAAKLHGAQFRWLNEQLYTLDGEAALGLMHEQPQLFTQYHEVNMRIFLVVLVQIEAMHMVKADMRRDADCLHLEHFPRQNSVIIWVLEVQLMNSRLDRGFGGCSLKFMTGSCLLPVPAACACHALYEFGA